MDPANEDDDGHGTHVASTIASPLNGLGVAGVAPDVRVVNIRAGQDSGFFFLQPTLEAIEYAGDIGVDVVNMSFYTDPWLYDCLHNPADTPAQQTEQRVIRELTQRAANYAVRHGVTPIAAEGNEADRSRPPDVRRHGPHYLRARVPADRGQLLHHRPDPERDPRERSWRSASPASASARRTTSNYGREQTEVAAPGGDVYDKRRATYPRHIRAAVLARDARERRQGRRSAEPGRHAEGGHQGVVRDCQGTVCAYYQYLQGTSMAAPHAVGVAALLISRFGHPDHGKKGGQLEMKPKDVERILTKTATETPCPDSGSIVYPPPIPASYTAACTGDAKFNSLYGNGLIDALAAVNGKK